MYAPDRHHVGDAWYFVDDSADAVHMFHLTRRLHTAGPWFVGHAVSRDLVNWDALPPALHVGAPGAWDDGDLCTGSVIRRGGRYWMAYAATHLADRTDELPFGVQRTGMAFSDDLVNWRKLPENPTAEPGPPHYEPISRGARTRAHWRDPFLIDTGDAVHALICASSNTGDRASRGVVGLMRSTDMRSWEVLPPLEHDRIGQEMEVPQVHQIDGRWRLVFCTNRKLMAPGFAQRFGGRVPERSNFAMVGDSAFGPFHIHGTGQIIPHGLDEFFYAAQLVRFHGRWCLLATIHDEAADRISDPTPIRADADGLHAEG